MYLGRSPTIGTQRLLDSIESQFNGTLTTFDLRYGGVPTYPTLSAGLLVSIGGVLQEPSEAYYVSSDKIVLSEAPVAGTECWILLYSEFGSAQSGAGEAAIAATGEPMGFENRPHSTISFASNTRTFSIAPNTAAGHSSYAVWTKGTRRTYSVAQSVQIGTTTGLYYIYFDGGGALQSKTTYFTWDTETPVAYVYWNGATGSAPFVADERHGIVLDWATHEYLHRTRGAVIAEGFSISAYTTTGDGNADAHAQFDLGNGTFFDEDLEVAISHSATPTVGTFTQVLTGAAELPVFYLSGSSGAWVRDTPTEYACKQSATTLQYNLLTGSTWSTTPATNNRYVVSWVVATNDINAPIIAILGQEQYTAIGSAEATRFGDLVLTNFPIVEFRPLWKVIFQTSTSFTNTPNARVANILDLRQLSETGEGGTVVSDHGLMSGLADDDHTQYLHASLDRAGVGANISTTGNLGGANLTLTGQLQGPANFIIDPAPVGDDFGLVEIKGNLTVQGLTTTINSTTLSVDDKNIVLGDTASPTDALADGGGITLKGSTDKTIAWLDSTDAWTVSEHVSIASAKEYRIAGTKVLDATGLGSAVVGSSLTSVGTIGTGTWQGGVIAGAYGGTGVANTGKTITLGGNLTTSGNFTLTLTTTAATSVTLPTTGTLATLDGSETLTNKTFTSCTFPTFNQNTTGNAATVTTNANLTGDITSTGNATAIAAGVIVDADVNASAAIAGTKISPDFGSQNITTTGHAGIGTNSPAERLHLHAPGDDLAVIRLSGTAAIQTPYNIRQGTVGVSNSGFSIYDVASAATRICIGSAGNVGIGRTNPGYKLDVDGSIQAYSAVVGSSPYILLQYDVTPANGAGSGRIAVSKSNQNSYSGKIHLQPQYFNGSSYAPLENALVVDATGGVGIGINTPEATLDISDSIKIRGQRKSYYYDGLPPNYPTVLQDRIVELTSKFAPSAGTDVLINNTGGVQGDWQVDVVISGDANGPGVGVSRLTCRFQSRYNHGAGAIDLLNIQVIDKTIVPGTYYGTIPVNIAVTMSGNNIMLTIGGSSGYSTGIVNVKWVGSGTSSGSPTSLTLPGTTTSSSWVTETTWSTDKVTGNNVLIAKTGNNERLRITSTGTVIQNYYIYDPGNAAGFITGTAYKIGSTNAPGISIAARNGTNSNAGFITFDGWSTNGNAKTLCSIGSIQTNTSANRANGELAFFTNGDASSPTPHERLRITSTGTVNIVGAGTAGSTQAVSFSGSAPANSLVLDSSGRVGLGIISPTAKLQVAGSLSAYNSTSTEGAMAEAFSEIISQPINLGPGESLDVGTIPITNNNNWRAIVRGTYSNNYEGGGLTPPSFYLELNSTQNTIPCGGTSITVSRNTSTNRLKFLNNNDTFRVTFTGTIEITVNNQSSQPVNSITTIGRVGVGTASPAELLHVAGTIRIGAVPGTNTNAALPVLFQTSTGNIDGGSSLTYNPGEDDLSVNGNSISSSGFRGAGNLGTLTCANGSGQYDFRATNDSLRFISGSSEAGRFDSGRNLLVGNSSTNIGTGFADKTNRCFIGGATGAGGGIGAYGFISSLSGTATFVVANNGALRVTIYSTANSASARIGQYIFVGLNKSADSDPVVQSTLTNSPNWTFSYTHAGGTNTLVTVTAPASETYFQGIRIIVEPLG